MNGPTLYSIGELARRTGTTVKTVRYYSDRGLLPPADRSPAGYRRYAHDAVARLDLVRTLRELGLDLAAVRKVVDRELALPEIAAVHADALDVQIRVLRLRRAVLAAVAERGATPEETRLMYRLAMLSETERRRLVGDFLGAAFADLAGDPVFAGVMRSMTPELPDHPDAEQVRAWVELAELAQDPGFRAHLRQLVEEEAAGHLPGEPPMLHGSLAAIVRDQVAPAVAAGTDPAAPQADPIVAVLLTRCAHLLDRGDGDGDGDGDGNEGGDGDSGDGAGPDPRRQLAARLERMNDPRRERYFALLAVINGWPAPESLRPVLDWAARALYARAPR